MRLRPQSHLPDQITFGVDNVTLGILTPASLSPGSTWVYNRPMQVILNLAVGGPWAGAPNKSTRFPARMLIALDPVGSRHLGLIGAVTDTEL
jgi:beta-glucanase (GH16 family)